MELFLLFQVVWQYLVAIPLKNSTKQSFSCSVIARKTLSALSLSFICDIYFCISFRVWQSPRCAYRSTFKSKVKASSDYSCNFKCFSPNLRIISCRQIDKINFLQWFNSCNKLPVFFSNRTGEIQKSYTTDQCHHILSSDNSADTVSRRIYSEGHRESSWVNGPSRLKTTNWPLETDTRTVEKIRLKEHSCDINISLENS